ncbi:MAG: DUF3592 domain-containing protein [Gloeobacteraceae cyanobacterium ES-bin-144]|nr:DUF3592 domain-containing protein [Verrucomicrobiales bacterium]
MPAHRQHALSTPGSRIFLVILGLVLALIGGCFVWLMARSFLRAHEMRDWPKVPCVIISSEIAERIHDSQSPTEYSHRLSFGYEWLGKAYTSDHLTLRGNKWSSKRALVEKNLAEFPVGLSTTCLVRPDSPDFAVLKADSLAPGYSIWFPALFVVGGLGISIRAITSRKPQA